MESYGGKVVILPIATEQSTTAIMQHIAALEAHRSPEWVYQNARYAGLYFSIETAR